MKGTFRTLFLVCCLLSQSVSAEENPVLAAHESGPSVSAVKSILFGTVLGSLVALAAGLAPAENRTYVSTFFVAAGAAGGLGYYFVHSASPSMSNHASPSGFGVTANLFSWNF